MAAEIIDGKAVAQRVREEVARDVAALDRAPGLAASYTAAVSSLLNHRMIWKPSSATRYP